MHKLQNGSQVSVRPQRKPLVGLGGYFSESNDQGAPSYPGQDWFNDCVDEFLNALGEMGITYDHSRLDHLARAFRLLLGGGKNLFESNQNFNVPGADGSLTSFNQTFLNGQEFSYGWYVVGGASLINAKIIDGELTADSGKIQRSYDKDPALLLDADDLYGSVISKSGTQTFADTLEESGIQVSQDDSKIYFTIDFSVYQNGVSIVGLSTIPGKILPISDDDSIRLSGGMITVWSGSLSSGVVSFDRDISLYQSIRITFNLGTHVSSSLHSIKDVLSIGRTISCVRTSETTNSFNGGLSNFTSNSAEVYKVDTSGFVGFLIRVEVI